MLQLILINHNYSIGNYSLLSCSLIVYYMVGLNPNVFGEFLGIVGLTALTAISLGK